MLRIQDNAGRLWEVLSGEVATGFVEGGVYSFRSEFSDARVLVDDVPLVPQLDLHAWVWTPGFYAGRVSAEVLNGAGRLIASCVLDVGPSSEKLGQPQFLQMVGDIMSTFPELLLGDGSALSQFGHDRDLASLEIAYARLRRYGAACIAAMRAISTRPLTRLQQQRRIVQPHQVRRLDVRTAQELYRTPAAGQLLGLELGNAADLSRVTVPHVERTFDHAANRTLAVMIDRLLACTFSLGEQFAGMADRQDERVSLRVPRRLQVLAALGNGLQYIRRSPVFIAVTRPEVSAAGLNAVSAHPDYASAFQLAWKALNMGLLGDEVNDPLPVGPTWQIYERWCFLRVWQMLQVIAPDAGWRLIRGDVQRARLHVRGHVLGGDVVLRLQPTFHAWDQPNTREFKSLSRQREPDIVVTFESSQAKRFLVLDAKYRASRRNVLDAMQSAHIYQDSLMWRGIRPWGSFLLLPRDGAVGWLGESKFQRDFKVGTFELAPEGDVSALVACITRFLQG